MSINIDYHPAQSKIISALFSPSPVRYVVAVCARGFGKSYCGAGAAMQASLELLDMESWVPNKNVYIIAPTFDQAIDVYFDTLVQDFGADDLCIKRPSKDKGRFFMHNNVELRLVSFEAIERMRGKGAYFVVNDEVSSWSKKPGFKKAWEGIIQPCITTRWSPMHARAYNAPSAGRALTISTPKGFNYLYDLYNLGETDPAYKGFHFDYTESPYLDPDEIEGYKRILDPIEFATEYLADFKESGNSVFYCFNRKEHVISGLPGFLPPLNGRKGEDVHVWIDFNVGIQASSVFAVRGGQVHVLDEFKGHPDTASLAQTLKEKYKGHNVYCYPDPTGNSRKTSAPVGQTDFSILRAHGITVCAKTGSPSIVDSVAAVNSKLKTYDGNISLYIDPNCEGTVRSFERTKWVDNRPDTMVIDKSEGVEHYSDGARYAMDFLFPIIRQNVSSTKSSHF